MRKAALVLVVVAVVACNKKKTEDKTPPPGSGTATMTGTSDTGSGTAAGTGAGTGSAAEPAGSGSAAAGSGSAAATEKTGFARFDDAVGGKPWLTDDEAKAGIVELIAEDDLSGKTKGKFTTEKRCGDAAKKAVDAIAAAMVKRTKTGSHDAPQCIEDQSPEIRACFQAGVGEGDVGYEVRYKKAGESWTLIGVKSYSMGVNFDKQDVQFNKLVTTKCK